MLAIDAQVSMLTVQLFSIKGIYFIRVTDISVHGDTFNLTWPFSKLVLYGCGYYGYFVFVINHDIWSTRIIFFACNTFSSDVIETGTVWIFWCDKYWWLW